jgi:hypothetical protein
MKKSVGVGLKFGRFLALLVAMPAFADTGPPMPPNISLSDENYVDALSGSTTFPIKLMSLGSGDLGLSLTVNYKDAGDSGSMNSHNSLQAFAQQDRNAWQYYYYYIGTKAEIIYSQSLAGTINTSDGGIVTYNADGTQTFTDRNGAVMQLTNWFATSVAYPNGKMLRYQGNNGGDYPGTWSVMQNNGLLVKYNSNSGTYTMVNLAYEYCNPDPTVTCSLTQSWPAATETWGDHLLSVTDSSGGQYQIGLATNANAISSYHDKNWAPGVAITYQRCTRYGTVDCFYNGNSMYDKVESATKNGVTYSFNYVWNVGPYGYIYQLTSPFSRNMNGWALTGTPGWPQSYQDEHRSIGFDNNYTARITRVTENGVSDAYTYDSRGNITDLTRSGSTLTATIHADYDATCTARAKCNKANDVIDANGNRTDYTYDTNTGLMLTESGPAVNGIRPVKRFAYVPRSAWYLNSTGGYTKDPNPIWLLATEKTCRTGATVGDGCAISGDEIVKTYEYGPDSGPNNLWLRGVAVTVGGVTHRTCYSYDRLGNKISETAARAGLSVCP